MNEDFYFSLRTRLQEQFKQGEDHPKQDEEQFLYKNYQADLQLSYQRKELELKLCLVLWCLQSSVRTLSLVNISLTKTFLSSFRLLSRQNKKLEQISLVLYILKNESRLGEFEYFPQIEVPEIDSLDFFFRVLPAKAFFAVALRSLGSAKVYYREDKEALYFKYKTGKKGLSRWKPNQFEILSSQETWLRKYRRDLFGGSSRDSRRPIAKVLVLVGETKLSEHAEHLYVTIGQDKFLSIRRQTTTYILEAKDLPKFIRAWQAQQQQQA